MAFFPNFLKWRYCVIHDAMRTPIPQDHTVSCEEALSFFQKDKNAFIHEPHLFLNEYDQISNENGITSDALYKISTSPELRKVLSWISKHILYSVGIDYYITVDVYVRIGSSMLNKLVEDGILTKDLSIAYHDNLIRNLKDLISTMNEESLPF